jgi:endonuclease/exonuclease/phosphatase family metal-dependent hydrolase
MRIVSWNIRGNRGASNERLDRIVAALKTANADIALLQEVFVDLSERLEARLRSLGFVGFYFSGGTSDMRYGNVVAARFALDPMQLPQRSAPWPHLLACARVETPGAATVAFSVHIPNGSKYKWRKIETFEALAAAIDPAVPTIVGGDFNEPDLVFADGRIASFLAEEDGTTTGAWAGHPRSRWQLAVDSVLGPSSKLRHVWLSRWPGDAVVTHVVRGVERFFDHLLASAHFDVVDANYEHSWREKGGPSDHSGAWVEVDRRS